MDFPYIDPVIINLGPVALRWYGLMYLLGFLGAWWLGNLRARKPGSGWNEEQVSDFLFLGFLGVVAGGRLGYVLFYGLEYWAQDWLYPLKIWEGGMSFHGGLLGVVVAMGYFARKTGKGLFDVGDFWAPMVPIGLGFGRLGNFINGELWGREVVDKTLPWAMRFRCDPVEAPWYSGCDPRALLRHPSQLYEFALEGVVLFALLWWFSSKPRPRMAVSGLFLLGYGSFRFIIEFYREPDAHLGQVISWLTMGQLLSAPMIVAGAILMIMAYRRRPVMAGE